MFYVCGCLSMLETTEDSIVLSVVGVNYKKADLQTRGKFGFTDEQKAALLSGLKQRGIPSFLLATCNRTELYFEGADVRTVASLFCEQVGLKFSDFEHQMYLYSGQLAKRHLLRVASGLDSQILGDFEIVGQIKKDYQLARSLGTTNAHLERWANTALQASKRVKSETSISTGASSVAFASIEYLKKKGESLKDKKVLIVGAGKIGVNTCKNLLKHTMPENITLANRTYETAVNLAERLGVNAVEYDQLQDVLPAMDVLVIATGASAPIIHRNHVEQSKKMVIFDLSVPRNVCTSVDTLAHTEVLDVDQLSKVVEENTAMRRSQVPSAERIVDECLIDLNDWLETRKRIELISSIKANLQRIGEKEINTLRKSNDSFNEEQAELVSEKLINKVVNQFALHLKSDQCCEQHEDLIKRIFHIQ